MSILPSPPSDHARDGYAQSADQYLIEFKGLAVRLLPQTFMCAYV